jgi:hypothetical protein
MADLLGAKITAALANQKNVDINIKELGADATLFDKKRLLRDLLHRMEIPINGEKGIFTEAEMMAACVLHESDSISPELKHSFGEVVWAILTLNEFYATVDAECESQST